MNRTNWRFGLVLMLAIGALAGCSKSNSMSSLTGPGSTGNPSGGTLSDQAVVSAAMATEPQLIEDGLAESAQEMSFDGGAVVGGAATVAIRPVRFWRRIDDVDRTFEFAFSDSDTSGRPTTAVVTIRKRLLGTFNILAGTPPATAMVASATSDLPGGTPLPIPLPGPRDTTLRLVHKPLEDHWVRRVLFKRVPPLRIGEPAAFEGDDRDDRHGRWRIAGTSDVKVTSRDAQTHIVSLRLQGAVLDTTITDPLVLFRLRRILRFGSGEEIHVTVTTGHNDDVVVLYREMLRLRFHNNGDNTYSAVIRAGFLDGVRHLGVNALSNGTLFDDAAPYDSQAWIVPYVVQPTSMADFLP